MSEFIVDGECSSVGQSTGLWPQWSRVRVPSLTPSAPVAQLDRASDFESAGRPFEPDRARHAPRGVHGSPESHVVQGAIRINANREISSAIESLIGHFAIIFRQREPLAQ